ncbi:hypothetical protein FRC08_010256 [Ceratobasidium sp. 394]|nr:hypothetical protein FRC08_010256 [Ceratobasidium sp. 394]
MTAYELTPKPGTYRIASVATNTVIEVLSFNQDRAVASAWRDEPNQRWFVQYLGRGYKIKNCQYGSYLAAPSSKEATVVGISDIPTTWSLIRTHAGFVSIQYGEEDRVIDLHHAIPHDCNILQLWNLWDCPAHRRWNFERISDDTGGEIAETIEDQVKQLTQELMEKNERLALQAEELAEKDRMLVALREAGTSERTASRLADIYGKLDEIEKLKREVRAMVGIWGLKLVSVSD